MNRIVLGIKDGSSAAALRFAYNAALDARASLEVITVARNAEGRPSHLLSDALARQGQVISEEIGLGRLELPMYCDAVGGDPIAVLCGRAIGADLLVIGGRPRRRLRPRFRRTLATQCVDRAPCPLVVVRSDVTVPAVRLGER